MATSKKKPSLPPKRRARPKPGFLERKDLDEMARRRCLMVLSVLSGERPVTDVIEEAKMSRGTYYHLEERALRAMLLALTPGADSSQAETPAKRIEELERKVQQLERDKRRSERLLMLTRKVVKAGPVTTTAGRRPSSTKAGRKPSPPSTKATDANSAEPSIPTTAGADER
jgi:hypothetical protein